MAAALGFGLSAVQGVTKYNDEKRQAEVNNRVKAVNNQKVQQDLLSTISALETSKNQIDEDFIAKSIDNQRAEAISAGAAKAASGASNTGGTGSQMQQQDIDVNSSINESRSQLNRERQIASIKSKATAAVDRANSRINRMPDQEGPDAFSAVLGAGMSGFRNTLAFDSLGKAYDSNYGKSTDLEFTTDSLYDAPLDYNEPNYFDAPPQTLLS